MKLNSLVSLTAIACVLVFGIGYLTFGVVRVDWFKDYTTATMLLTNSGSLAPRSPVLLRGVKVGEITSVDNVDGGVEVKFRVDDKFRIPTASTVMIENLSALGEPYVQFTPTRDGGPYLESGERIDTKTIQMPLSIPEVARTVTNLLNQLDPKALSSIVNTLDQGLAGTESIIPQLAKSTNLLAATILSRSPQIRSTMTDLQAIGADMEWAGPSMAAAGPEWGNSGTQADLIAEAIGKLARIGKIPDDYVLGNGLVPFLNNVSAYLIEVGPDLQRLVPIIQPLAAASEASIPQIDISALISQALNATGDDGALRLQINIK